MTPHQVSSSFFLIFIAFFCRCSQSAMAEHDVFIQIPNEALTEQDTRNIRDAMLRMKAQPAWDALHAKWEAKAAAEEAREQADLPEKKIILAKIADIFASLDLSTQNPYSRRGLEMSLEKLKEHLASAIAFDARTRAYREAHKTGK
jgi:hypothetical protein